MSIPESAVERFNAWGRARRPFVFAIPYDTSLPCLAEPLDEEGGELYYSLPGVQRLPKPEPWPSEILWEPEWPSLDAYRRAFDIVQHHLKRGDSYLTNLCMATPVRSNLSPDQIFCRARAPYRLLLPGRFACFSPELFVRMRGELIETCPMKGTSEEEGREALLADEKEQREHATVVDLLRNDLALVGSEVSVGRYRYAERLATQRGALWATSSLIQAHLPRDWQDELGTLLARMLPAGSVTGAPKLWTCRVIEKAETCSRGYYTGIFGVFDGEGLESAVSIRFVERLSPGRLLYRSGGGVTTLSDPVAEYEELCRKVYLPLGAGELAALRKGKAEKGGTRDAL